MSSSTAIQDGLPTNARQSRFSWRHASLFVLCMCLIVFWANNRAQESARIRFIVAATAKGLKAYPAAREIRTTTTPFDKVKRYLEGTVLQIEVAQTADLTNLITLPNRDHLGPIRILDRLSISAIERDEILDRFPGANIVTWTGTSWVP